MLENAQLVLQLTVGLVCLLALPGKLFDPVGFAVGVKDYRIVPNFLSIPAAVLLILVELFLMASHLTGWLLSCAAPLGVLVFACFSVAVASNRNQGVRCYCFGSLSDELISPRTLVRLLLLLVAELLLVIDPAARGPIYPYRINNLADFVVVHFWAISLLMVIAWIFRFPELSMIFRGATLAKRD